MKKIIVLFFVAALSIFQAHAVLKEKNLSQTLGVLRAELEASYNDQMAMMQSFEKRNVEQHANLIRMMQKSNQIALMLYSQNEDFTFDMAYACQEATEQYRTLKTHHLPYSKMMERINAEIERYNGLIKSLQDLPPRVLPNGELAKIPDSIRRKLPTLVLDTSKISPFVLDKQGREDREACLKYATALRDNYVKLLEGIVRDQEHYERVTKRVGELNTYAMSRYEKIQKSIFVNGGKSYFVTLQRFRAYYAMAKKDVDDKYRPLKKSSEWRGPVIVGVTIFTLFYIALASLLSYVIMRWLLPKRLREKIVSKRKRFFLTIAIGVGIFALSIMTAYFFVKQNFILMAISMLITFAWLMEVMLVSLLIRLKDNQIRKGVRVYVPFIAMAFVVIVFRIVLIPNNLVNLIFPPILLLATIWQFWVLKRTISSLPDSDKVYSVISLLAMIVSCVASWLGFVLLAVQIMMWWTIQLAAIQTITCCYDLAKMYEYRHLLRKIAREKKLDVKTKNDYGKLFKKIQPSMAKGEYIAQTWFFDFLYKALLPIAAVASVLLSVYFAAGIFEMTSMCRKIFLYVFLNKPGLIQLSLFKICLVLALYFFFRYLNYAARAFYQLFKKRRLKDIQAPNNMTLINNVISIVVWGLYVITSLVLLQVPGSGISIVAAGLATGLGFAMKDLLENFFYGISLMTGRIRVGDYIECDGIQGKVDSINYQSTQIVTLDGCVIAFLNTSLFNKNFKNLTRNHGYVLVKIPVGVAYGANVEQVRAMLIQGVKPLLVKNAAGKNIVDMKQGVSVAFSDFGDSSVNLNIICWVLVEEKISFVAKVNEVVYNTLNKNHVEIPFPQRDVYVRHVEMPNPMGRENKETQSKKEK